MTDKLKDDVIRTSLNAAIRYDVITAIYEDRYIVRVKLNGKKDFIGEMSLADFRANRTNLIFDKLMKAFHKYIYEISIDREAWKIVLNYLTQKEYLKQEKK